jgi:hypothetical protein
VTSLPEWQLATPKTRFSLPIADCRLTIEKALAQFPALSISPSTDGAIENDQFSPSWAKP